MKRFLLALLAVSMLLPSAISVAQSGTAEGNGFRISPTRTDLIVERGDTKTFTVGLENITDAPINARAIVNDFVANPDDENGSAAVQLDENAAPLKSSLRSFVSVPAETVLEPKERKEFKFSITVPQDARPGGYYGVIRFVPARSGEDGGNVGLTASVGSLLLVEVPGEVTRKLEIEEFGIAQKGKGTGGRLLTKGPVTAVVRLKNTGDVHIKPFGKINLRNSNGDIIASQEINQAELPNNVLPDSIRRFELTFDDQKKMFGKYTIDMNIAFEQGSGEGLTAKKTFYVYPIWFLGVVLLGVLAAVTVVYMIVIKVRKHRR